MIEVMMAKNKMDRYNNVDELLEDLKEVQAGENPMLAHKRMDVSALEKLEDGETVDLKHEEQLEHSVAKYKNIIIVMVAVSAILLLVIIMLLLMR
jgi:hypothetical protein